MHILHLSNDLIFLFVLKLDQISPYNNHSRSNIFSVLFCFIFHLLRAYYNFSYPFAICIIYTFWALWKRHKRCFLSGWVTSMNLENISPALTHWLFFICFGRHRGDLFFLKPSLSESLTNTEQVNDSATLKCPEIDASSGGATVVFPAEILTRDPTYLSR